MVSDPSPRDRLRDATRAEHERIDASDYARAVSDGTLSRERLARLLRALHVLHVGVEGLVERAAPAVREAYRHGPARRLRLEADLARAGLDRHGVDAAVLHALVLLQKMRLAASDDALLGHLYVLEGSQLGGLMQAEMMGDDAPTYFAGAPKDTAAELRAFFARLDLALADPAALARAIDAARTSFEGFQAIVDAVMSQDLDQHYLSATLNDAAGTHATPRDVREVAAAIEAGEQSLRDFRYYAARYGERGRAFTRSDSAWLATLVRQDASAERQVSWLARVLGARGMPRLLMERHLVLLHAALVAALPDDALVYLPLAGVADTLASERRKHLDDDAFEAAVATFDADDGPIDRREAGTLVVAAVIDEAAALPRAVESLRAWLASDARSQAWRDAFERTLAAARAQIRARQPG